MYTGVVVALLIIFIIVTILFYTFDAENFVVDTMNYIKKDNIKIKAMNNKSVYMTSANLEFIDKTDTEVTQVLQSIKNMSLGTVNMNDIIPIIISTINTYTMPKYNFVFSATGNVTKDTIPMFIFEKNTSYMKAVVVNIVKTGKEVFIKSIDTKVNVKFDKNVTDDGIKRNKGYSYHVKDFKPIITQDLINKERSRQELLKKLNLEYNCFGVPNAEQHTTKDACVLYAGTWDAPVLNNKECPFFMANKNYNNVKGISKSGYCELPASMSIIGYRYYNVIDPNTRPLCYNCKTELVGKGTLGYCCEQQKNTKDYPSLKSPDYQFPGDNLDRIAAGKDLSALNLSVF